jgi:hypothetical protein
MNDDAASQRFSTLVVSLLKEMCDLTSAPEMRPAPPGLSEQARKEGRTDKEGWVLSIGDDACMQVFDGA